MNHKTIASPCVSICVLDEADICQGCYRSADEITRWGIVSDEEKQDILKQVRQRSIDSQTILLK